FSGALLIIFGLLLLLHNYGHLSLGSVFKHWWPLIFIFWGATKLYERTVAQRMGRTAGWITPGEVFLVLGLITIVGMVIAVDMARGHLQGLVFDVGDPYTFSVDVPSRPIAPDARIMIHGGRGTITVRSSDDAALRVTGEKSIRTFSESDAEKRSKS